MIFHGYVAVYQRVYIYNYIYICIEIHILGMLRKAIYPYGSSRTFLGSGTGGMIWGVGRTFLDSGHGSIGMYHRVYPVGLGKSTKPMMGFSHFGGPLGFLV